MYDSKRNSIHVKSDCGADKGKDKWLLWRFITAKDL